MSSKHVCRLMEVCVNIVCKTCQATWGACVPPMDLRHRHVVNIFTASTLILLLLDKNHTHCYQGVRTVVVFLRYSSWMLYSILNGSITTTTFNSKLIWHKIISLVKTSSSGMEYIHLLTFEKDCYLSFQGRNLTVYPEDVCVKFPWNNGKFTRTKTLPWKPQ